LKEVTSRFTREIVLFFLSQWVRNNKSIQTLIQPVTTCFQSFKSAKMLFKFLSEKPFEDPYDDLTHPFNPDYTDPATGNKIFNYKRDSINEYWAILGDDLTTRKGNVSNTEKQELWKAHETNAMRQLLRTLIDLKPF
jgi:hypothetical protein